jgi:hypothetical protein
VKTAGKFAIVALTALALTALPGGSGALNVVFTLLTIAFFSAIAVLGYRLYRRHRFELDSLSERQRLVLYSSIGLAFLTFCATSRMFGVGGVGAIAWVALLGICSYGLYWVWTQYRSYG